MPSGLRTPVFQNFPIFRFPYSLAFLAAVYCTLLCCALPPQAYQPSASLFPVFKQISRPSDVPA